MTEQASGYPNENVEEIARKAQQLAKSEGKDWKSLNQDRCKYGSRHQPHRT